MTERASTVAREAWSGGTAELAAGVTLLGEYEGSGFTEPHYLIARPDGQVLHVSQLLYLVAAHLDARTEPERVAATVSEEYGRTLSLEGLQFLIDERLRPMGVAAHDPAHDRADDPTHDPATAMVSGSTTAPPAPPRADLLLKLRLKRTLVPARLTRVVARCLAPLFHPVVVVAALAAVIGGDVWLVRTATLSAATAAALTTPVLLLGLLGLLLVSTLVHEFGHAAACHRGGAQPGDIGVAVYLVYPAFFTDVTSSYRLGRAGRLRTDLGGVYFNALTIGLLTALLAVTGYEPLVLAIVLVHLELLQQLMPIARLDGYFVVADLVGVPDLFGRVGPILAAMLPGQSAGPRVRELRRTARVVITAWVLTAVPVMVGALVYALFKTPAMVASIWEAEQQQWRQLVQGISLVDPAAVVLAGLSIVLLPLPLAGLALLVGGIARRLVARVVARVGRPTVHGPRRAGPRPLEVTMSGSKPAPVLPMLQPNEPTEADERAPASPAPSHSEPQPSEPHLSEPAESTGLSARETVMSRSAADFTEEAMLRPSSRPPARGWRRGVYTATRGGVNLGPSAEERRQLDILGRVRTPVRGCRRIVVISRKGGAGKTTTALMLGHTLASHRGDRVVALDANPDAGSLAHRMRRETTNTVTTLLAERDWIHRYADMRGFTSQAADTRLEVVASDDDPRITQALGEEDYRRAIEILDRHYNLVIVDTGTGILDSAIQGILAEADQLVVVMPPALDGARVAAMTLDWLEEHHHGELVSGAVAVVNAVHGKGQLEIERIEEHFSARCRGVIRIPWDPVLQAGAHTSLSDLGQPTRDAYLELAATVAGAFGPSRGSGAVPLGGGR
jgi:putative peptide zinc metalloprotease protein